MFREARVECATAADIGYTASVFGSFSPFDTGMTPMNKFLLLCSLLLAAFTTQTVAAWSSGSGYADSRRPPTEARPGTPRGGFPSSGFQIQHYSSANGYHIRIASRGESNAEVKVAIEGRRLTLSSQKFEREERRDDSGRYRKTRSGSFTQQITLPDDADMRSLRRREKPGLIEIFVPRKR
jgi:HSP20 family molecular chaperone IbpA